MGLPRTIILFSLLFLAAPAVSQQFGSAASSATDGATHGAARSSVAGRAALSMGTARSVDTARGDTLTLEQAFRAAIEGSRDLDAARDRVLEAHIDIDRAWATLRPGAALVGQMTRNDKEVRFVDPAGGERLVQRLYQPQVSASLRQVVFHGQALPTVRALEELRAAAKLESERLFTELLYAVSTSFYSVLALQGSVALAQQQVEGAAAHLEVVSARHELDAANRLDLLRAEIDHRTAIEDLRMAKAALESVKVALGTLIGRPHDEGDFAAIRPSARSQELSGDAANVETALSSRRDLGALERQVAAADHLVTAARMAFLPSLDLTAGARYTPVESFLLDDQVTWFATVGMTIPIYQGGLRRQQLDASRLRLRQAGRARESMRDRVRMEVLQARLELENTTSQLERLEGTAELSRETLDLVRARYEVGAATSLEITDAATRSFLADTNVVRGQLELDMATLGLARAMGMFEEILSARYGQLELSEDEVDR